MGERPTTGNGIDETVRLSAKPPLAVDGVGGDAMIWVTSGSYSKHLRPTGAAFASFVTAHPH